MTRRRKATLLIVGYLAAAAVLIWIAMLLVATVAGAHTVTVTAPQGVTLEWRHQCFGWAYTLGGKSLDGTPTSYGTRFESAGGTVGVRAFRYSDGRIYSWAAYRGSARGVTWCG